MRRTLKVLDIRGGVKLLEETLSDGSKVYDVSLYGTNDPVLSFHAESLDEGIRLFKILSASSFTVYT